MNINRLAKLQRKLHLMWGAEKVYVSTIAKKKGTQIVHLFDFIDSCLINTCVMLSVLVCTKVLPPSQNIKTHRCIVAEFVVIDWKFESIQ